MSISKVLGARDVTVVNFHVSRMKALLEEDEMLKRELSEIIDVIVCTHYRI